MHNSTSESLGRNLRRAMDNADVRSGDLVRELDVSHSTVANWKQRGVSAGYATLVADMLGVKPHQICSNPAVAGVSEPAAGLFGAQPGNARTADLVRLLESAELSSADIRLLEWLVERLAKDSARIF